MWSYAAERLVEDEPPAVHAAIAALVAALWGDRDRVVHDDGLTRRLDAIAAIGGADDPDVWLSWVLTAVGSTVTHVRLTLHEVERGPDPTEGLVEVLTLLNGRLHAVSR